MTIDLTTLMKKQLNKMLVIFSVAVVGAAGARADDVLPPSYRGVAGSTLQIWGFDTAVTNPAPDSANNPIGTPTLTITPSADSTGIGWQDSFPAVYGSKQGFWDLGDDGHIDINIPTSFALTGNEQVRLQITYWQSINVVPTVFIPIIGGGTIVTNMLVETGPHNLGRWYSEVIDWSFAPGATNTLISIFGDPASGSVIDQVTIDTVPEPSPVAFFLLGSAALAAMLFNRRRASRRAS
jgi:hypothetical protein